MFCGEKLSQGGGFLLCGPAESGALSVAFAVHLDDGRVMDQSVDGGRGHGGIAKQDMMPLFPKG
jgi:hypothetical protein